MRIARLSTLVLLLVSAAAFSGCANAMFNRGTLQYTRTTTIGQELLDLSKAKDDGILTEEEYVKLKNEIMKGGPFDFNKKPAP